MIVPQIESNDREVKKGSGRKRTMEEPNGGSTLDAGELQRQLEDAGLFLAVEIQGNRLVLAGEVESEGDHEAALDVVSEFARQGGLEIDDSIEVLEELPETTFTYFGEGAEADDSDTIEIAQREGIDPADEQRRLGTSDPEIAAEEAIPYFPPTDPVVEPAGGSEELDIVGGFGSTSFDRREQGHPGESYGDEEITSMVRRELREDSATTDFDIEVETHSGVVSLRGTVETLDDAENVEAVASRVAGVLDVREELEVISLMNPPLD
jgi:osmotically-inducible protein OsmY